MRLLRATAVITALSALLTVAGCGGAGSSGGALRVVAGENVWGDIARQIGGSHVRVTSIVTDPTADPHTYETDPLDAAAVAEARLVIENGAGYDDFLAKEVAAAGRHPQVLTVATVVGALGADVNPHLWYSPTYVAQAAVAIEADLAAEDPADRASFATNLAAFRAAYQPYVDTVATIRARHAGTSIAYTERVPGYLVDAAGLRLGTPAGFSRAVEDGADPTPADTAAFDAALTGHRVAALLYNDQVVDDRTRAIKQRAQAAGVPVVGVAETIPARYATFQAWQLAQARALLAALGG